MLHDLSRRTLGALVVKACLALSACGTAPSRIISPGPMYTGAMPIERLSVYVFIDVRPEYVHPSFRKTFEVTLSDVLAEAGIPSRQVWSLETREGQRLQANWKDSTMGPVTTVSVGRTLQENRTADAVFGPSHMLVAFPKDTYKSGEGAVLDIKWDIIDAGNGNVEWSVYTRTSVLSRRMKDEEAVDAARGLIDVIAKEMQARSVIRR